MSRLKKLIGEVHRRSLWQVLGIYLAGSWIALQVVETLTESMGLPGWVQPFAFVLLVIGFRSCRRGSRRAGYDRSRAVTRAVRMADRWWRAAWRWPG